MKENLCFWYKKLIRSRPLYFDLYLVFIYCLGLDPRTDTWTTGWMDGRTEGWTDGRPDRRMDGRTEGWTDGRKAGRKAGRKDGRTAGRKDGRMDGRTDGRTDGRSGTPSLPSANFPPFFYQISFPRPSFSFLFLHLICSCLSYLCPILLVNIGCHWVMPSWILVIHLCYPFLANHVLWVIC